MSQFRKNNSTSSAKKIIFNANDVAERLNTLKNNSQENTVWWTSALKFEWNCVRKGNNGTQWISIKYTDANGVTGSLVIRVNGEVHTGQIMPAGDAEVAILAARSKQNIEKRNKKPVLQFQMYKAQVKTAEDGITPLQDNDGNPILPDADTQSPYYKVANFLNEAFAIESREKISRGSSLIETVTNMKKADKTTTIETIIAAFVDKTRIPYPGGIILSAGDVAILRKLISQKELDLLTKGVIVTPNTRVVSLVQEFVSDQAKKNAGLPLPNPITRVAMNFDQITGVAQLSIFDKSRPYVADGQQKYEAGKVNGEPVNNYNVHEFIKSRSTIDAIITMDCISGHSMGISIPVKAEVIVVDAPVMREVGLMDVYDTPYVVIENTTKSNRKASPEPEENYDGLLDELSGGV